MTVQWERHRCQENPKADIETTRIDGKCTGWQMKVRSSEIGDSHARFEMVMFIDFCPFCGERLV